MNARGHPVYREKIIIFDNSYAGSKTEWAGVKLLRIDVYANCMIEYHTNKVRLESAYACRFYCMN